MPSQSSSSSSSSSNTGSTTTIIKECECEPRLSALESSLTNIQSRLSTLETIPAQQAAVIANDIIRVFPNAYSFDEHAIFLVNDENSEVLQVLLLQEYPNDALDHLYIGGDAFGNGIKVKGSKYEQYFSISGGIQISRDIMQESELHIAAPDFILQIWTDFNAHYMCFSAKAGKKHTTIDGVRFDIDYNLSADVFYQIKMTFPETVTILNNEIPAQNISAKQGSVITLKQGNDARESDANLLLKDNNLDGENSFTLVAQGAAKKYEIVFYWYKTYIPEFV
jgi:hypothetical protein